MFKKLNFDLRPNRSRRTRSSDRRSFRFEALESRDLMAGNVMLGGSGGNLVITGDNASNGVKVTRIDATTYQVDGTMVAGAATRLNGELRTFQVRGVTGSVTVALKGGDDEINFHGNGANPLTVPGKLTLDGDSGNDKVGMFNVKVGGDMLVKMGSGVDSFTGVTVNVGNNLFVHEHDSPYYAGNYDYVNIYNNSRVGNQLQVKLHQGNDVFKTERTTVGSLWLDAGAGNDSLTVDEMTAKTYVRLDPGMGSDVTTVEYSTIGDDLFVTEAAGTRSANDFDTVIIGANKVTDYISVEGNRGRENVRINGTTADRLYASLGAGDDTLNIKSTTIRSTYTLNGGAGSDTLNQFGNNKKFLSSAFETFWNYDWL